MPLSCRTERKVVARHRDLEQVADLNLVVEMTRAAAARFLAQHRNAIMPPLGGIVAQRVLPHEPAEPQIDMRAGHEPRQVAAARIDELVPIGGLGEIGDRTNAKLHDPGLPELREGRQAFCMLCSAYARINRGRVSSWLCSFAASSPATTRPAALSSRSTRSRRTWSRRGPAQPLAWFGRAKAFRSTTPTRRMLGSGGPVRRSTTARSSA